MSDVAHKAPTFFALYSEDQVTPEQIDDYVEAWHDSGDAETPELHEYLGMTWEEYGVLMMTRRTLPLILAARRADRPLREFVEPFFEMLLAGHDANDKPTLHTMSYWLYGHPPAT